MSGLVLSVCLRLAGNLVVDVFVIRLALLHAYVPVTQKCILLDRSWPFDLGNIVYGECCCSCSRTGAGNGETYSRGLCCKVKSDAGAQADGICKM